MLLPAMPKVKLRLISFLSIFLLIVFGMHYISLLQCNSRDESVIKKQKFDLIILVLSAAENVLQRDVIRRTWLFEKPSQVKNLFSIGIVNLKSELLQTINSENLKYNDLLLLPQLYDSYESITQKVLQSLVHIYENYDFEFLLKSDDDSFILLNRILNHLKQWQIKRTKKELYWGYFHGRARVKKSGPWKETDWFLCDYYLPYALGGGYILSYNLVKFIAENADILKLYNSEDVSVGLWLAPLANIERKHDTHFDTEYRSRGCSNQYIVTHKQSIQDMKKMHEIYSTSGNLCVQEVSNYLGYEYNWTVAPSQCCDRKPGIP